MPLPQTQIVRPEWVAAQDPSQWLTPAELKTLESWSSQTRRGEWLAGRLAAKRLLREEFGCLPLDWTIGKEGVAPCLLGQNCPPIILSLSHSQGLGAASWSDSQAEGTVGIDVQHIRPVHAGLYARVFTSSEQAQMTADDPAAMLLFWAIKEAAVKARRAPWGRSLREIQVSLTSSGSASVQIAGEPEMTAEYWRLNEWWLARALRPPV